VLQRGLRAEREGRLDESMLCLALVAPFLDEPSNAGVWSALAMMQRGQDAAAFDILSGITGRNPDNELAQAALALARRQRGDPTWKHLCGQLLATSTNPRARQMAEMVMSA
jgi:hypothetical protein